MDIIKSEGSKKAIAERAKAGAYIYWARAMRPIERRSPRSKDRIVMAMVRAHVALYRRAPRVAASIAAPTLIMTVPGRKTGKLRESPAFYMADGDRYVVVGSYGGDHRHPQWYHNLMAAEEASIEVGSRRLTVTARLATSEERAELWPRLLRIWPNYDEYQEVAGEHRELPVVVLTPR